MYCMLVLDCATVMKTFLYGFLPQMGRRAVRQADPDNRQYVNFASSGYVQSTAEIRKYIIRFLLSYTFNVQLHRYC